MGGDNSPALGEADPDLALASQHPSPVDRTLELQRDARGVASESDDIEPPNTAL